MKYLHVSSYLSKIYIYISMHMYMSLYMVVRHQ